MKRSNLVLLLGVCVLAFSANTWAGGLDGSKPLVCDLVEAAQCDGVAKCREVEVDQIELPAVVHVDFEGSKLTTPDDPRTSPIKAVEALDAVLVLQGHQNGRGWTMVIERETGHLSATLAGAEGAFVLAGACTAL